MGSGGRRRAMGGWLSEGKYYLQPFRMESGELGKQNMSLKVSDESNL